MIEALDKALKDAEIVHINGEGAEANIEVVIEVTGEDMDIEDINDDIVEAFGEEYDISPISNYDFSLISFECLTKIQYFLFNNKKC